MNRHRPPEPYFHSSSTSQNSRDQDAALTEAGIIRSLYDPTAGTGGMLSLAEEHLLAQNPDAKLSL